MSDVPRGLPVYVSVAFTQKRSQYITLQTVIDSTNKVIKLLKKIFVQHQPEQFLTERQAIDHQSIIERTSQFQLITSNPLRSAGVAKCRSGHRFAPALKFSVNWDERCPPLVKQCNIFHQIHTELWFLTMICKLMLWYVYHFHAERGNHKIWFLRSWKLPFNQTTDVLS